MGAVVDRLDLDVDELKDLMGVTSDEYDARLGLILASAKEHADEFMNNPFTNTGEADGTEEDIPSKVKLGVVRWCSAEFDRTMSSEPSLPYGSRLTRTKTDQLEEEYARGVVNNTGETTLDQVDREYFLEFKLWSGGSFVVDEDDEDEIALTNR